MGIVLCINNYKIKINTFGESEERLMTTRKIMFSTGF